MVRLWLHTMGTGRAGTSHALTIITTVPELFPIRRRPQKLPSGRR